MRWIRCIFGYWGENTQEIMDDYFALLGSGDPLIWQEVHDMAARHASSLGVRAPEVSETDGAVGPGAVESLDRFVACFRKDIKRDPS